MKKFIQNILLKLAARARAKRIQIEIKQQKTLMLEVINLPRKQRKRIIEKRLWDYRKKMNTPEGKYISWWCDAVRQAGRAIDALREREGDYNLVMSDINFHAEHYEKAAASNPELSGDKPFESKVKGAPSNDQGADQKLQGSNQQETKDPAELG